MKFSVRRQTLTYEKGFREALLFTRSLCHQNPGTQQGLNAPPGVSWNLGITALGEAEII